MSWQRITVFSTIPRAARPAPRASTASCPRSSPRRPITTRRTRGGEHEPGEMVINAPTGNTTFDDLYGNSNVQGSVQASVLATAPQSLDPLRAVPTQVLTGPYQLELRRGTEYGISDGGPLGSASNN